MSVINVYSIHDTVSPTSHRGINNFIHYISHIIHSINIYRLSSQSHYIYTHTIYIPYYAYILYTIHIPDLTSMSSKDFSNWAMVFAI